MAEALIHTCFNPEWQTRPSLCGCNVFKRWREAEGMVTRGEASFMTRMMKNGKEYPDFRNVVLRGKQTRFPMAQRITCRNVQAAYLEENRYQQERIEASGEIQKEILAALGATVGRRESILEFQAPDYDAYKDIHFAGDFPREHLFDAVAESALAHRRYNSGGAIGA